MPGDTAVEAPVGDNDKKIDEPVEHDEGEDDNDDGSEGDEDKKPLIKDDTAKVEDLVYLIPQMCFCWRPEENLER